MQRYVLFSVFERHQKIGIVQKSFKLSLENVAPTHFEFSGYRTEGFRAGIFDGCRRIRHGTTDSFSCVFCTAVLDYSELRSTIVLEFSSTVVFSRRHT